jgi:feruloyl esterase
MYAGTTSEFGLQRYTGAKFGSEADWDPNFADNGGYGNFIGHYVYSVNSPPFDWRRDVNFSTVYDQVKAALTPITAAPSPDLTAFKARGGKLIQFAGWNDSVVPPDGSVDYYHSLTLFEKLHTLPDGSIDALTQQPDAAERRGHRSGAWRSRARVPSAVHAARGGALRWQHGSELDRRRHARAAGSIPRRGPPCRQRSDQVGGAGVAPDKIIATRFTGSNLVLSRPLCPYPAQAVYNGSGNVNDAASFSCVQQVESAASITPGDIVHIKNSLLQRKLELPNR